MQNNHQSLCIATLNISGLLSNILYAEHCLNRTDILVIQEHWLYPDSLGFLQTFHEDFTGWGYIFKKPRDQLNRQYATGVIYNINCSEYHESRDTKERFLIRTRTPYRNNITYKQSITLTQKRLKYLTVANIGIVFRGMAFGT